MSRAPRIVRRHRQSLSCKIDLTATVTQQALTPGGLFNSVANAWSIAASVSQPIFDGGQLSAQRRAAVDNYQATLAIYRQTILAAFNDVADRLQDLANDADTLKAENKSAACRPPAQSLDLARRSYQSGQLGHPRRDRRRAPLWPGAAWRWLGARQGAAPDGHGRAFCGVRRTACRDGNEIARESCRLALAISRSYCAVRCGYAMRQDTWQGMTL